MFNSETARRAGKRSHELHPELCRENGFLVHKLHPNQSSEMGKRSQELHPGLMNDMHEKLKKEDPTKYHEIYSNAQKRQQELYPDLSRNTMKNTIRKYPDLLSENGKLVHKLYPDMASKTFRKSNIEQKKNNPETYYATRLKGGIASHSSQHSPPNNPESYLLAIIQANDLPFQFTGDGSFWIKNHNPDFTSTNGENVVIEVLGEYWHGKNRTKEQEESRIKNHYSNHGYKCIIFWENELNLSNEKELLMKMIY